jgi:hypothetical protein
MTRSVDVRADLVDVFRRDLVGPGPQDADLATERLNENPSRWYLTGFLAPADDPLTQNGPEADEDDPSTQEEMEIDVEEPVNDGSGGAASDAETPETPNTKRRFLPSSIGITVLLPPEVTELEAHISWGDYRTEPPLSEDVLIPEEPEQTDDTGKPKKKSRPLRPAAQRARQSMPSSAFPRCNGTGRCAHLRAPRPIPLHHRA